MKNRGKQVFLCAALALLALPVVAQSTTQSAPVTGESIQERKENQQDRIANGVKSGQLTAGETANLEKKESSLNQEEHDMRKLDNGKLTAADKATLSDSRQFGIRCGIASLRFAGGFGRQPRICWRPASPSARIRGHDGFFVRRPS